MMTQGKIKMINQLLLKVTITKMIQTKQLMLINPVTSLVTTLKKIVLWIKRVMRLIK